MKENFDIIVIGAGHAGCEAALASARMGLKTALFTINLDMVGFMPCNPSIGGPAKGVVVREIDALGGEMGRNIDATYIQMRMLNTGKGPAVRALRAQADKDLYSKTMKATVEATPNLVLRQHIVDELIVEEGKCVGVITSSKVKYGAKAVVVTTGTALKGEIVIGELKYSSGPNNSLPANKLSGSLKSLGFEIARFKTGTPPRVKSSTINYDVTEIQPGDTTPNNFSYDTKDEDYLEDQIPCWLTYTNATTHQIINDNLHRAPMFTGIVEGVGARYCPSIEDKIVRFSDKPRHQLFLEPEGRNTEEVYVQGFSSSMPEEVQHDMVHSVPGLENAEIMRTGYAIEYDVVLPHQLKNTFETKLVENLYTAGQTNGTSGYEEAAGQGLYAGINAALKIQGKSPLVFGRDEAYIGVLVDDLVTKGTLEPYRLLTSRAEFRLLLRHDNADLRLSEYGHEIGLLPEERYAKFAAKKEKIEKEIKRLAKINLKPTAELQALIVSCGGAELKDGIKAVDLLKRPEMNYADIKPFIDDADLDNREAEQVEITVKYEGYIKKALANAAKLKKLEARKIPDDINYQEVGSLANEAVQKLEKIRPATLAQASRISGVNPADINVLMIYLETRGRKNA
ncbi:MAG: tRNA uridine-5-carboxymethylaminomethyl(34) synthesis enzyme MnmG [Lactobacillales bacterium]|nr:tRNA uridine-5-carboxymethylaminomethyl(34) synthesis enzyme MnmG [Lactobacillales bacterium]